MCRPCVITAILFLALVVGGFLVLLNEARAEEYPQLLISEFMIQPTGERFVELYNPNNQSVELIGWYIQRKTKTGAWGSLITSPNLEGYSIPAQGYFVIAREGSAAAQYADILFDSSMTMTDDNSLRLRNPGQETADLVGYGDASEYENAPAPAPENGKSLARISSTGNNQNDFEVQAPTPGTANTAHTAEPEPKESEQGEQNEEEENEQPKPEPKPKEEPKTPEPSIEIIYDTEVSADDDFFVVELYTKDLPDKTYDVKISIVNAENKNISNIYNKDAQNPWPSATFYIQNAFNRVPYNGNFLKHIRPEHSNYEGNATIIAQIREHEKSCCAAKTEGNIYIRAAKTKEEAVHDLAENTDKEADPAVSDSAGSGDGFEKTDDIRITEFIPYPEGPDAEEEWIEIYNSGNKTYDLSGWQIALTEGKSKPFTFGENTIIGHREYRVFWRPATKLALINSGDTLKLLDPDGDIAQKVTYPKAPRGQSYALIAGEWTWTDNITPGYVNLPPTAAVAEATSASNSKRTSVSSTGGTEDSGDGERDTITPEALSAQIGAVSQGAGILVFVIAGLVSVSAGGAYIYIRQRAREI